MATVYVFNASDTVAFYWLNEGGLGPGLPYAPGPNPPRYTPVAIAVPRRKKVAPGEFGQGRNRLAVRVEYPPRSCTFFIDPGLSSADDDLVVYVTRSLAFCLSKRGYPPGEPAQCQPCTS